MDSRLQTISISVQTRLRQVMQAIDDGACGIALVTDEVGRLEGTITDGDVRRAILSGSDLEAQAACCINRSFSSVPAQLGRMEVLDIMRSRSLKQLPIVDDEGRLVGLHLMREIIGSKPRPNWAVIMAGGRGTRLQHIVSSTPKPMLEVAGRPILERIVMHLVGYGVQRIFIAVNYLREAIEEHFEDGSALGCRIEYLRETEPLGTGGALSLITERPTHPLLVLNGDVLTQFDVRDMLDQHSSSGASITVAVHEYVHQVPFGVVEVTDGLITKLDEKPSSSWLVNAGVYVVQPELLSRVPRDVTFGLTELVSECLQRKEPVKAFPLRNYWFDIGRPVQLSAARGEGDVP